MFIPKEEYLKIQAALPILCIDCLIMYREKCLLLRRTQEPAKGQYWFPGGRIFKGELIADAAMRKARDEVNLECTYEKTISIEETIFAKEGNMPFDIHTVNICCRLSVDDTSDLAIDGSHDGYLWVTPENIQALDLHPAVYAPLLKCFE